MTAAPHILRALFDIDDALGPHGVPRQMAEGEYWRAEAIRFYGNPTAKTLVECCGRGAGKDLVSIKMELAEVLAGGWRIPEGERHYSIRVSENLAEAGKARRILVRFLQLLNVPYTTTGDAVDLGGLPLGFLVLACRVGAVSGFRAIGWTANECAKWDSEGTNPSAEVIASIKAMTVTHPEARGRVFSSPMARAGYFYEAFAQGETSNQVVGGPTPSWVANRSITEAHTRSLEPDLRVWAREYAAEPSASESAAFSPALVDPCFETIYSATIVHRPIVLIDTSSGKLDSATHCGARYVTVPFEAPHTHLWMVDTKRGLVREDLVREDDEVLNGQVMPAFDASGFQIPNPRANWRPPPRLQIFGMDALEGAFAETTSYEVMIDRIAAFAHYIGAHDVVGDDYLAFANESAFQKRGLRFIAFKWTNESKGRAVLRVRQFFRERILAIEAGDEAEKLRRELLAFRETITPAGNVTYNARVGAHDDRVALLLNAALCEMDERGLLRGSPIGKDRRRYVIDPTANYEGRND